LQPLFATLDFIGLALLLGVAAAWLWLTPLRAGTSPSASPGLGNWFGAALLILALTSVLGLLLRTSELAEVGLPEAWSHVPKVIADTDFGHLWLLRAAMLVMLALLWAWRRDPPLRGMRAVAAIAALMIAFVISATGHMGDEAILGNESINNAAHIAAGCLWGGSVSIYVLAILPRLRGGTLPSRHVGETAGRLSMLAAAGLLLVVLTGTYNAWEEVGSISALWTTQYGRILVVKLVFVAAMAGIGAFNRFVAVPAVQAWAQPPQLSPRADAPVRRFARLLKIDVVLFAVILAAAAILATTTPSLHEG
jgi:putative copper resistance protein D